MDNKQLQDQFQYQYVHKFYAEVYHEFDQTRNNPWPAVIKFVESLPTDTLILDAGCGNGKNSKIRSDIEWHGFDMCDKLLAICQETNNYMLLCKSDIQNIGIKSNIYDYIICIAVLHHLPTYNARINACNELIRLVKSGGKILIEVWEDKERNSKFKPINKRGDYMVEWRLKDKIYDRYYHMFKEDEIDRLCRDITDAKMIEKYREHGNWIIILQKD